MEEVQYEFKFDLMELKDRILKVEVENTTFKSKGIFTLYFHPVFGPEFAEKWICQRMLFDYHCLQQIKEVKVDVRKIVSSPVILKVENDKKDVIFELPSKIKDNLIEVGKLSYSQFEKLVKDLDRLESKNVEEENDCFKGTELGKKIKEMNISDSKGGNGRTIIFK